MKHAIPLNSLLSFVQTGEEQGKINYFERFFFRYEIYFLFFLAITTNTRIKQQPVYL
jgi:hypothetical protein